MPSHYITAAHHRTRAHVPVLIAGWNDEQHSHLLAGEGEYSCGSAADSDVRVTLTGVADNHCLFRLSRGSLYVRKADGRIWVNDLPVTTERRLLTGDVLAVGPAIFYVDGLSRRELAEADSRDLTNTLDDTIWDVHNKSQPDSVPQTSSVSARDEAAARDAAHRRLEAHVRKIEEQLQRRAATHPHLDPRDSSTVESPSTPEHTDRLEALTAELTSRDQRIANLLIEAEALQQQLADRGEAASTSEAENAEQLQALYQDLERRESELRVAAAEFEQHVTARRLSWEGKERALEQRDAALLTQQSLQDERAADLQRREAELEERALLVEDALTDHTHAGAANVQELEQLAREQEKLCGLRDQLNQQSELLQQEQDEATARKTALLQLQAEIEERTERLAEAEAAAEQRSVENDTRTAELQERLRLIKVFRAENAELIAEFPHITETVAESRVLRERIEELRSQLQVCHSTIEEQQTSVTELTARCDQLSSENELLQATVQQRDDAQRTLQADLDAAVVDANSLRSAVATLQETLESAAAEIEELTSLREQNAKLRSDVAELQQLLEDDCGRADVLNAEIANLQSDLEQATNALEAAQTEIADWEARYSSDVADRDRQVEESANRCRELEDSLQQTLAELKLLESAAAANAGSESAAHNTRHAEVPSEDDSAELLHQLELLQRQRVELETELTDTRDKLATLHQDAEIAKSRHLAEVNTLEQQLTELSVSRDTLASQCGNMQADADRLVAELQASQERCTQVQKQLDAVAEQGTSGDDEQLAILESELQQLSQQLAQKSFELTTAAKASAESEQTLRAELQARDERYAEAAASAALLQEQNTDLQSRLNSAADELNTLRVRLEEREQHETTAANDADAEAELLLHQLEELRAELADASSGTTQARQQFDEELIEKGRRIDELTELLNEAEELAESRGKLASEAADALVRLEAEAERALQAEEQLAQLQQELQNSIEERTQLMTQVGLLQSQCEQMVAQLESSAAVNEDSSAEELAQLRQQIDERDVLIRDMKAQILRATVESEGTESTEAIADELTRLSRELDQRAMVLDTRDEDLQERFRAVERTEEELETQRRQLQEARQQLEIARADIQVAISTSQRDGADGPQTDQQADSVDGDSGSESEVHSAEAELFEADTEDAPDVISSVVETAQPPSPPPADSQHAEVPDDEEVAGLKSELANLFGLKLSTSATQKVDSEALAAESFKAESVDLSEPIGATGIDNTMQGIALSFEKDIAELACPSHSDVQTGSDSSDAAVHSYMEDLLERTRQKAGGHLPVELDVKTSPNEGDTRVNSAANANETDARPEKTTKSSAHTPVSFIEQYMSGAFGNLGLDDEAAPSPRSTPELATRPETTFESSYDGDRLRGEKRTPKRIDRDKLREDMDSFRSLTARSVERALADHAIRQQRRSSDTRMVITTLIAVISVSSLVAGLLGIVTPIVTWVAFAAAAAMGVDLVRSRLLNKRRLRKTMELLTIDERNRQADAATGADADIAEMPGDHAADTLQTCTENEGTRSLPAADMADPANGFIRASDDDIQQIAEDLGVPNVADGTASSTEQPTLQLNPTDLPDAEASGSA
jgi:chromosome segregation ATPase